MHIEIKVNTLRRSVRWHFPDINALERCEQDVRQREMQSRPPFHSNHGKSNIQTYTPTANPVNSPHRIHAAASHPVCDAHTEQAQAKRNDENDGGRRGVETLAEWSVPVGG